MAPTGSGAATGFKRGFEDHVTDELAIDSTDEKGDSMRRPRNVAYDRVRELSLRWRTCGTAEFCSALAR